MNNIHEIYRKDLSRIMDDISNFKAEISLLKLLNECNRDMIVANKYHVISLYCLSISSFIMFSLILLSLY